MVLLKQQKVRTAMKKCIKMIISAVLICSAVIGMYFIGKADGYDKGYRNGRKDEENINNEPDKDGENSA